MNLHSKMYFKINIKTYFLNLISFFFYFFTKKNKKDAYVILYIIVKNSH